MAITADVLLNEARCYECNTSGSYGLEMIKLALLRRILLEVSPTAVTDPDTLLNEAKCYQCSGANGYMLQLMELALLAQIANPGGSSSGGVTPGSGPPSGPPASGAGIYYDTTNFVLYVWNNATSHWDQIVGP